MVEPDRREREWLEQTTYWMLKEFQGTSATRTKAGRRKLRLFACGCCRLIWSSLHFPNLQRAVEIAEQFADGCGTVEELTAAGTAAHGVIERNSRGFSEDDPDAPLDTRIAMVVKTTAIQPFVAAIGMTTFPLPLAGDRGSKKEADALIRDLLRDVFGNPFRPVAFSPSWRTDTAVSLARGMYESRDFSAMPILADALQDAGCDSDDVLNHCRDEKQVHVRGCWVVDLVLGKA